MLGFDAEKYLEEQSINILERIKNGERLYLEFGGKLMFDMHAKRVLPGYDENAKIKLLHKLKDKLEVIIAIYAGDIARNKTRQDFGITYDLDVFRLMDDLRKYDLTVNSVVITRYENQPAANVFINKLERRGIKVYKHLATAGYPTDVDLIVSDEGYGANPYIETTKPLIVVTGPGPGSGKLATCLSQLYHENKRGVKVGYSKFETFPVWNLPLKHPVNVAYEAATVDLKDVNMIDSFHLDTYGIKAINYNRDLEVFPVIKRIIEKITGAESMYQSPTDMGVNKVGFSIIDDQVVRDAAQQEIVRRYFKTKCEYKKGLLDEDSLLRSKLIMDDLGLKEEDRTVVGPARAYADLKNNGNKCDEPIIAMAIELPSGKMVTGRSSKQMVAAGAAILNSIKELAGLSDEIHIISPIILTPIENLKLNVLNNDKSTLDCEEVLFALSISAATNPTAQAALDKLSDLRGARAHCTAILSFRDEQILQSLGVDVTSDAEYSSNNLYYI